MARQKKYRAILAEREFEEPGVEYVGDIEQFMEEAQEKSYSAPAIRYSIDKDDERDKEYLAAARNLMYSLHRKEIEPVVMQVLDILHGNTRMKGILEGPNYLKLVDEITKIIFLRKFNGLL